MSDINFSFEMFPPKTSDAEARLWDCAERLARLGPAYFSVTYGAGGSTRERTLGVVERMARELPVAVAGHITCSGAPREEVDDVLRRYWAAGVKRIVALRGDPAGGVSAAYEPHAQGYAYASDLIAGARAIADFDISVGCYPECHPEARGLQDELDNLKRKFDAGATRAITQFFFDPDIYLRFLDAVRDAGITQPIIPGIMLQSNLKGLSKMARLCGAYLPPRIARQYDGIESDLETRDIVTANIAADICSRLRDQGVTDFHFYTMNRPGLPLATCRLLDFAEAKKSVSRKSA